MAWRSNQRPKNTKILKKKRMTAKLFDLLMDVSISREYHLQMSKQHYGVDMGRYIAIVVPLSAECNPSGYKLGPPY